MTSFLDLLEVGDLRSDGLANEVVRLVSAHPELLPDLLEALAAENPNVRGHAADALEKVARSRAAALLPHVDRLARQAISDDVPMVRWHLAMVLAHILAICHGPAGARRALVRLLSDPSPFVRSWAISGLTITSRDRPRWAHSAVRSISPLTRDPSPAVAKRARTAIRALTDPEFRIPRSWIKTLGA